MSIINRQSVCNALVELGSIDEQRRLWLSTGANDSDVSSFSEAVEQLFTDTGLCEALVKDNTMFPQEVSDRFKKLQDILHKVDCRQGPEHTINDPMMTLARELSGEILLMFTQGGLGSGGTP